MSATNWVLVRCHDCGQSFEVFKDTEAYNRAPFICDPCLEGHKPSYDKTLGGHAQVTGNSEDARQIAVPGAVLRAPMVSQPTVTDAANAIVPAYSDVLAQVDPEEAARQEAARAEAVPADKPVIADALAPEPPSPPAAPPAPTITADAPGPAPVPAPGAPPPPSQPGQ